MKQISRQSYSTPQNEKIQTSCIYLLCRSVTGGYGVFPFNSGLYLTHNSNGLYVPGLEDQVQLTSAFWSRGSRKLTAYVTSSLSPFAVLELDGFGPMTFQPNNNRYEITVQVQRASKKCHSNI